VFSIVDIGSILTENNIGLITVLKFTNHINMGTQFGLCGQFLFYHSVLGYTHVYLKTINLSDLIGSIRFRLSKVIKNIIYLKPQWDFVD